MDSNQIILKNKQLHIQDRKGRTLLYADENKVKLDLQNMEISGICMKDFFSRISLQPWQTMIPLMYYSNEVWVLR